VLCFVHHVRCPALVCWHVICILGLHGFRRATAPDLPWESSRTFIQWYRTLFPDLSNSPFFPSGEVSYFCPTVPEQPLGCGSTSSFILSTLRTYFITKMTPQHLSNYSPQELILLDLQSENQQQEPVSGNTYFQYASDLEIGRYLFSLSTCDDTSKYSGNTSVSRPSSSNGPGQIPAMSNYNSSISGVQLNHGEYQVGNSLDTIQFTDPTLDDMYPRSFPASYDPGLLCYPGSEMESFEPSAYLLDPKKEHAYQQSNFHGGSEVPYPTRAHQQRYSRLCQSQSQNMGTPSSLFAVGENEVDQPFSLPRSPEDGEDPDPSSKESGELDDKDTDEPYAKLIYRALIDAKGHAMSLQDIYQWFIKNTMKAKAPTKGWQNSIRHNLSMNGVRTPFVPRVSSLNLHRHLPSANALPRKRILKSTVNGFWSPQPSLRA
jgi:hypothetical protein